MNSVLRKGAKALIALGDFPFRRRPGPRVLIYHQVGSSLGRQMELPTEVFKAQLEWVLSEGSVVPLDEALARADEPDSNRLFVLTFDDGYRDVYQNAFPLLATAGVPFLVYVTTEPVETQVATVPGGGAEPLTWTQLEEMAARGATIGSHTHTHLDLRAASPHQIDEELATSDELIKRRIGISSEHFCYPYGYWSKSADSAVRGRYKTATLGAGAPISVATDRYLVPRIPVQLSDGYFFFVRKMKSGMVYEENVRRRLSGYEGVAE